MIDSDPGESAKETIILVHGTFAAPRVGGPSQWYQPRSEFCQDLDARLKKLGSRARCWAHLTDDSPGFFWSGRNDWTARAAGAADLARLMHALIKDGWRVHVVAHSHGGNVLLEALDIGAEGFAQAHDYDDGCLVLMGTPIMELRELAKSRSGMSKWNVLWKILLSVVILLICVRLAWSAVVQWIGDALAHVEPLASTVVSLSLAIACLTVLQMVRLLAFRLARVESSAGSTGQSQNVFIRYRDSYSTQWKRLLILNSDADEAFQVLSRLADMVPMLLAPAAAERGKVRQWLVGVALLSHYADQVNFGPRREGVTGFTVLALFLQVLIFLALALVGGAVALLVNQTAGVTILAAVVALIAVSFFSRAILAFLCVPARIVSFLIDLVVSALLNGATWTFRRWGGRVLRDMILGVSGFPLRGKSDVSFEPGSIGVDFYEFRKVPDTVITPTLETRSKGVVGWLDALTSLLSNEVIAANDALEILKKIAEDTTLVHASYYQHELCRQQIAEWLARDLRTLQKEAYENQPF
jgi:pimeloyl-ACP methyl ester carboxylesterase